MANKERKPTRTERLKAEIAGVRRTLDEVQQENRELRERCSAAHKANADYEKTLKAMRGDLGFARARIDALETTAISQARLLTRTNEVASRTVDWKTYNDGTARRHHDDEVMAEALKFQRQELSRGFGTDTMQAIGLCEDGGPHEVVGSICRNCKSLVR